MDQQFINIETMTFRDFVRMANEMEMHPTSLLLKLAPQCGSLGHQGQSQGPTQP